METVLIYYFSLHTPPEILDFLAHSFLIISILILYKVALSREAFLFFVPSLQWCPHNFKTSFKISCLYFQTKLMEF